MSLQDLPKPLDGGVPSDEHLRALPLKSENLDAILRDMKSCVERFERWSREQRQQLDVLKRNVGGM